LVLLLIALLIILDSDDASGAGGGGSAGSGSGAGAGGGGRGGRGGITTADGGVTFNSVGFSLNFSIIDVTIETSSFGTMIAVCFDKIEDVCIS
jgi:hypothetical protein